MEALARLSRRQLDGGIDRVPLPADLPGALFLSGKHAIGRDHRAALAFVRGVAGRDPVVVCLVEPHELRGSYDAYVEWLDAAGTAAVRWPVPDFHAPPLEAMLDFVDDLARRLRGGEVLLIHCAGGTGRTGTTAVCLLIRLGVAQREAEQIVAQARPGAGPEMAVQRQLVEAIARLGPCEGVE
jgi:hypothetical protein